MIISELVAGSAVIEVFSPSCTALAPRLPVLPPVVRLLEDREPDEPPRLEPKPVLELRLLLRLRLVEVPTPVSSPNSLPNPPNEERDEEPVDPVPEPTTPPCQTFTLC